MKKSIFVIALTVGTLTLGACAKKMSGFDNDNTASFEMAQMSSLSKSLSNKGLDINEDPKMQPPAPKVPASLAKSDLDTLHTQLTTYIQLGDDAIEKIGAEPKSSTRDAALAKAEAEVSDAEAWLKEVDSHRAPTPAASNTPAAKTPTPSASLTPAASTPAKK